MKLICAIVLTLLAIAGFSQDFQPQYEHINVENGLPDAHVTNCLQDKFGYIWIGTGNGLVRYNGYTKRVYRLETSKPQNLTSLNIQALFEDSKGHIWVGTFYDGLFRYNRETDNFSQIKHQPGNNNSLATNDVHQIQEDGNGNLYVFTFDHPKDFGYVNQYNPTTGQIRRFGPDQKGPNFIPVLPDQFKWYKDNVGALWLSSRNGLFNYDRKAGKFRTYMTEADSAKQIVVSKLYQSPSAMNKLWFADLSPKNKFRRIINFDTRTKTYKAFTLESLKSDEPLILWTFFEDKRKNLWIGTNEGLSRFDMKRGSFVLYAPKVKLNGTVDPRVMNITEDNSGILWLSAANRLISFDPTTNQFSNLDVQYKDEIDLNRVYNFVSAFQDSSGSLWFQDRESLHRFKKEFSVFNYYRKSDGSKGNYQGDYLFQINARPNGRYLLVGSKGLISWDYDANSFTQLILPEIDKKREFVFKTSFDQSGSLWGTIFESNYNKSRGLFQYDLQKRTIKFHKSIPTDNSSPSSDFISFMYTDRGNQVWIGTYNKGIYAYSREKNTFTRYPFVFRADKKPSGELDDISVNYIYEDRQNTIWVGTAAGGLNRLDRTTGKFTSYFDVKKGLSNISFIHEDKKGRFWVASQVYGLHLFDRTTGTSTLYSEKDGLLSNGVMGIAEDQTGILWLSTTRGLSRFDPQTKSFRSYTNTQGLTDTRLTGATTPLKDGRILISSYTSFVTFDPSKILLNLNPPIVNIETISYLQTQSGDTQNKEVVLPTFGRTDLELLHDENRITFTYAGLHYKNAALNQYAYQLEGYDQNWIPAGGQRSALYTNLSPGAYIFKVKASNADGIWNEKAARFSFKILPPWWLTWWAYTGYALLFAVALRSYTYYRSRALRRENQLLEAKIGLRTKELSEANKDLNKQRDQLSETVNELKSTQQQLIQSEKLASLGELTAGIAHEIQNPLNFVNNFSEVSIELAEELQQELLTGDMDEAIAIASDIKQNLQKIIHHGQRAGGIVKGMLLHTRKNSGERVWTDMNDLTNEYLKLSYGGLRAKDNSFNATVITQFDPTLPKLNIIPQDIGRVLLNLFNNAFYAVRQKQKAGTVDFKPEITVSTALKEKRVEMMIRDNGTGIPDSIKHKVLQPFFTTKPTGEGTGLGLSISNDILKAHGGNLIIESREGEYTVFLITLPIVASPG